MSPLLVVLAAATFIFTSCGEKERERAAPGAARLVVTETLPPMPRYTEGSIGFLRVRGNHGDVIVDGRVPRGVRVPPGEYRLISFQRPCDGNCGLLDPPVDRCERTVVVGAGEVLRVHVVLHQRGGCTMRIG